MSALEPRWHMRYLRHSSGAMLLEKLLQLCESMFIATIDDPAQGRL